LALKVTASRRTDAALGNAGRYQPYHPGTLTAACPHNHLATLITLPNMKVINAPRLIISGATKQLNAEGRLELTAGAPLFAGSGGGLSFIHTKQIMGCSRACN